MHYVVLLLSTLFMAGSVYASSVTDTPVASLSAAMNQRLLVMKDVAGYKARQHLPVEDLPREQKVIAQAQQEASEAGLDPQTVVPFIQAQMNAAKAIQYRYLADWLSQPETRWQPRSLEQVRSAISAQDKRIVEAISEQLRNGEFSASEKEELAHALTAPHFSEADKQQLIAALAAIKRKA